MISDVAGNFDRFTAAPRGLDNVRWDAPRPDQRVVPTPAQATNQNHDGRQLPPQGFIRSPHRHSASTVAEADERGNLREPEVWLGERCAVVTSGAFSGEGSAWFDRQYLKETFVAPLHAFPLSASDPPLIDGGFCIAVRPYDSRGTLLVQVDLASESWATPDKDKQQHVTARFLTEYAPLEEFASSLEQVSDGKGE
jgi:hypothetical protein